MSTSPLPLSGELYAYYRSIAHRETAVLARLREETALLPNAQMQVAPEQGQFLRFLAELSGARRALEVGVFTGYSALCVAAALPPDGRLTACDVSEEWTAIGRRYWKEAGVDGRIDLRIGPGQATLRELEKTEAGTYDLAFIDADKTGYDAYYESALVLVRPGGLIALDNVLRGGRAADPANREDDVVALRTLNEKIQRDERVTHAVLPFGDGLTLARKR